MAYIKKVFAKLVFATPILFSPLAFAEKSDYNMPVGVTDVSESIFELHMVIFLDLCSHWCNSFLHNVLVFMEV